MKLIKTLANLGYGSRKEVQRLLRKGAITDTEGNPISEKTPCAYHDIRHLGEPLDPASPLTLMLHKPDGYTCSMNDPGAVIYDLLPGRFAQRKPALNPVGRLDKDTTGLLLMTDDGKLLHKVIHPKSHCPKVYIATLDRPLEGHEEKLFASGELMLNGETQPLLPAKMEVLGQKQARITLHEGRYHQVRRMFAAAGNHVTALKRVAIGSLDLPEDLEEGQWVALSDDQIQSIFAA